MKRSVLLVFVLTGLAMPSIVGAAPPEESGEAPATEGEPPPAPEGEAPAAEGEAGSETSTESAVGGEGDSSDEDGANDGKDPPLPPGTNYQIELEIQKREAQIEVDRKRGIGLLEEFINKHANNSAMPEALYRLASLYWERSQERFLEGMRTYASRVDKCKETPEACPDGPPPEPQLDLTDSQGIYQRLLDEYPQFRKIDTVMFLYAFSLRDQGKIPEAQALFWRIIKEHPNSSFVPDAWMAVGDHRFYVENNFSTAKDAYMHVLDHPTSDSYAMALFKTAWCHWRLGQREDAIRRFKDVLDQVADPEQDEEGRKRLEDLREEALEYLVQVLTEDETQTPKDIYDFLAEIGGAKYSRKVLIRLASAYENQARYDKSVPAYRFLIGLDPAHAECADFQVHVFIGLRGDVEPVAALDALAELNKSYAPRTSWGKAHPEESRAAWERGEGLLYNYGRSMHQQAQAAEAATKVPDKTAYGLVARGYTDYMLRYPSNPRAVELSYLSGDIYYFKLQVLELAGDSYLRVGESAPVGPTHRDALLAAMSAYEEAIAAGLGDRPAVTPQDVIDANAPVKEGQTPAPEGEAKAEAPAPAPAPAPEAKAEGETKAEGAKEGEAKAEGEAEAPRTPAEVKRPTYNRVERKFIRATDLFAALFPEDEEIGAVIYRLGEFFYGRGDYDSAVQRFGKVVVDYPSSSNAAAAGDRILESLAGAKDYDNIELWANKLKGAPAFASKAEQERLDRIIVESLLKQGETLADRGYYARAANYYLRVATEYPKHEQAPLALNNAGASLERAQRAAAATDVYKRLSKDYAGTKEAGEATLIVAKVYENIAAYEDAAENYDVLVDKYKNHKERPDALYNAGVLYQALGEEDKAIARYKSYSKQYPDREDALDVELRVGQVQASSGKHKAAVKSFDRFTNRHARSDRVIEAHTRKGNSQMALGKKKAADKSFGKAAKKGRDVSGKPKIFAAEARYNQGEIIYAEFQDAKLDSRPKKLKKSLEKKAELLNKAKDTYLDVLSYNVPEWSTAALYRIGESFEGFAKSLREYPIPEGLTPEEEDAYLEQLSVFALAFEEQAIEAYRSGYGKAMELKIFNRHTRNIREALGRLSSQDFPPIVEVGTEKVIAEGKGSGGRTIRKLSR